MRRCLALGAVSLACASLVAGRASAAPEVLASTLPVAGIAAAIMDGVGEPELLLEPGASPHAYSLRPSQARALATADLILWIGPEMERFLVRPLDALGPDAQQLSLIAQEGIELLPFREGAWFDADDDHGHDHGHDHDDHDDHGHEAIDAHIWLSPANGRVMAAGIAEALAGLDPANASLYADNLERFDASLDDVEREIDAVLQPVRGRPFVVFHDAYRYFEEPFDIAAAGAVHVNPDVQPGAARVALIQERIAALEAVCVFAEPQFEPRLIETLVEDTDARVGVLDPLGGAVAPGPDAYGQLLLDLATSLADCLEG